MAARTVQADGPCWRASKVASECQFFDHLASSRPSSASQALLVLYDANFLDMRQSDVFQDAPDTKTLAHNRKLFGLWQAPRTALGAV